MPYNAEIITQFAANLIVTIVDNTILNNRIYPV
jgi:hypothetical protein